MRRLYLDNLRWLIVWLVVVYHICYLFNLVGAITTIQAPGVPAMDAVEYLVYPWFMVCLFVIAGIAADNALKMRTAGQFLRERACKLLVPGFAAPFLIGWVNGVVLYQYVDVFGGNGAQIPGPVQYLLFCLMGIGPCWFAHELFLACLVLLALRRLDKNGRLRALGSRCGMPALLALGLGLWGAAQVLNTPIITVYRNGIYLFSFLAGYCVFSHERVQALLIQYHLPLLAAASVTGAAYTACYWGQNYTSDVCLQSFFTNFYAWIATLAVLGCGGAWLNFETAFTRRMCRQSYGVYILHYPLLCASAWALTTYLPLPKLAYYPLLLAEMLVVLPLLTELVLRVPGLRLLLLGVRDAPQEHTSSKTA